MKNKIQSYFLSQLSVECIQITRVYLEAVCSFCVDVQDGVVTVQKRIHLTIQKMGRNNVLLFVTIIVFAFFIAFEYLNSSTVVSLVSDRVKNSSINP